MLLVFLQSVPRHSGVEGEAEASLLSVVKSK